MERERERESGGMMKEGRDKAGNLSGRFSLGQEMHSYMAQKSSSTYMYIYTPEAPLSQHSPSQDFCFLTFHLFFLPFVCVISIFREKESSNKNFFSSFSFFSLLQQQKS